MSTSPERLMRPWAVVLGLFYLAALLAATALAYAGALWLGAPGWRTQVAAGALLVGWVALMISAIFVWKFVRARQGPSLLVGIASGVIAIAAYAVVYAWGGRMLI